VPKIIEIRKCLFKLQLKMLGVFFETQCIKFDVFAAHVGLLHWIKSQTFPKYFKLLFANICHIVFQTTETYYQLTYCPCNKSHACTKSTYV